MHQSSSTNRQRRPTASRHMTEVPASGPCRSLGIALR